MTARRYLSADFDTFDATLATGIGRGSGHRLDSLQRWEVRL